MTQDNSPRLDLPYILSSQAQKHVTHNEAIKMLDVLVQGVALSRSLSSPPASPNEGDAYIVSTGSSGNWLGKENSIAAWQDGIWVFYSASIGWRFWITDISAIVVFDGNIWQSMNDGGGAMTGAIDLLGINAAADTTNRLSVGSAATLFTHEGDDHRMKINRSSNNTTASLIFQTDFSARAELGNIEDNQFRLKVSADGTTEHEAFWVDAQNGVMHTPNQPYFSGEAKQDYSSAVNTPDHIIELNTILDNGNNWDDTNHQFIVPVSGNYFISWTLLIVPNGVCSLRKNGTRIKKGIYNPTNNLATMSTSTILPAIAGDTMDFEWWFGGGYYKNDWSSFVISKLG
ncbi:MAG: DUF2793 domain-containing protein [Pseudomonadota bacterium]